MVKGNSYFHDKEGFRVRVPAAALDAAVVKGYHIENTVAACSSHCFKLRCGLLVKGDRGETPHPTTAESAPRKSLTFNGDGLGRSKDRYDLMPRMSMAGPPEVKLGLIVPRPECTSFERFRKGGKGILYVSVGAKPSVSITQLDLGGKVLREHSCLQNSRARFDS